MTSDHPEPAELLQCVRQQLILAQVRIMELEDVRDELAPRLTQVENLLAAAQNLADRKVDEAAHLEGVRDELHAQLQHLRHVQHVTNEALEAARRQAAAAEEALARERDLAGTLRLRGEELAATIASLEGRLAHTEGQLTGSLQESTRRLERIGQLDAEMRAMKTSRSWRWTAWLRSMERVFRRSS